MTETLPQLSFTSPSPWCKPTDATRRRCSAGVLATASPAAGGHARRGSRPPLRWRRRRCARRAGGAASGWQRDAVHTGSDGQRRRAESMVIATASCGGRACAARQPTASPVAATACAARRSSLYPLHSLPPDPPRGPEVVHSAFFDWTSSGPQCPETVRLASSDWTVSGPEPDLC